MTHRLLLAVAACGLMAAAASVADAQPTTSTTRPATQSNIPEIIVRSEAPPAPGTEVKSKVVNYGDLNISSDQGARTLLNRISAAAKQVCMPMPKKGITDTTNYNKCVDRATLHAVQGVNAPTLEYAYKRKYGPH
jgi:UrcA family protein